MYKFIDLFCGCGGLSLGFQMAGMQPVAGIDFKEAAIKTYQNYFVGSQGICADILQMNENEIREQLGDLSNIDIIIGGPPCQGFSVAGPRDMNDKRNTLYTAMVELAERVKPQAVVLENVPGMVQTNGGIGAKRVVEDFAKISDNME